jgi:hypothetical protein
MRDCCEALRAALPLHEGRTGQVLAGSKPSGMIFGFPTQPRGTPVACVPVHAPVARAAVTCCLVVFSNTNCTWLTFHNPCHPVLATELKPGCTMHGHQATHALHPPDVVHSKAGIRVPHKKHIAGRFGHSLCDAGQATVLPAGHCLPRPRRDVISYAHTTGQRLSIDHAACSLCGIMHNYTTLVKMKHRFQP